MRALKIVVGGLISLVLIAVLIGLVLPGEYRVERAVDIAAPPDLVFEQVNDLRRWHAWSPWIARDPSIQNAYSGRRPGEGQSVTWTSEHSGEGTQTITLSTPHSRIETRLDFGAMGSARADWSFVPQGNGTHVTWGLSGENAGPVGHYFTLLMDDMVGADYEDGLRRLKEHAEKLAKQNPAVGREAVAGSVRAPSPAAAPPVPAEASDEAAADEGEDEDHGGDE